MRKKLFSVIITTTILTILSCHKDEQQTRWVTIDLNYTGDLDDIFLLPNDTIMLLSRFDGTYQKTCIFKSDNAGRTWKQNCFDILTPAGVASFYCFNHLKIFAGTYRSYDGGKSWQTRGDFRGAPMHFFNDEEGIGIVGSLIYKTTDGGNSSRLVFDSITYAGFHYLQFFDNRIGYASGGASFDSYNSGLIVKTTDGGNTWQPLPGRFKSIIGMSFITTDIGYIVINLHEGSVVGTYRSGAELLKTMDGGNTWTSINDRILKEFYIIPFQCYFADEKHGFLCGSGNGSKILYTSDGGKTWEEEYSGISSDYLMTEIIFTPSGTGYAIGNNGLLLKRVLY
jgi:photosystem II stability/assembly factor-like uncharacterized protein